MTTYQAHITGTFDAYIEVETDNEEAARQIAEDTGCEIRDVSELRDFKVEGVEVV
jgi:hypothetical protein